MSRVSVLISSYNHEKYIAETIESVLCQTYQDFEIIVVLDGSTDRSEEIVRAFNDPRIYVYKLPYNQGISLASNAALAQCTGEFIAILDSDDLFSPHKLIQQIAYMDAHPECLVVCTHAQLIDEGGNVYTDESHPYYSLFNRPNRSQAEWLHRFFFRGNCVCHPSALIRRSILNEIGGYDISMQQMPDYDLFVRLLTKGQMYIIQYPHVKVRVRESSANNSAYTPQKEIVSQLEHIRLLDAFTSLPSELAIAVFAEYHDGRALEECMVPYLVAVSALNVQVPSYQLFAQNTLRRMINDDTIRKKLYDRFSFTTKDYYALCGQKPLISSDHLTISHLFIDTGRGFVPEQCITYPIAFNSSGTYVDFRMHLTLPPHLSPAKALRFDPLEGYACAVRLSKVEYQDEAGCWQSHTLDHLLGNGTLCGDEWVLPSIDPILIFPIATPAIAVQIVGSLRIIPYAKLLDMAGCEVLLA